MHPPYPRETHDVVIAAAYWLMHRYQHTRCARVATLVEQHLGWVAARAADPRIAEAHRRLLLRWRVVSRPGTGSTLH